MVALNVTKDKAKKRDRDIVEFIMPLLALVFALLLGAILIAVMGLDVGVAYTALLEGAFGSKNAIGETIVKATPLIFTALSYALAKRCGLVNLGAEGQIYVGGMCSAIAGLYLALPTPIHIPVTILAGFIGGGLWGMLAGALKLRFGASEMITTIMLNYIAQYIINFMVGNVIKEPGDLPQSAKIGATAQLPRLVEGTRIHLGIIIALICVVLYYVFLWRTRQGYETRVVGINPEAARYAGFNTGRRSLMAMFMAGGLAGLAGLTEILGIQLRVYKNFSPGYGWDGIAAALLGRNSPIGIVLSSTLFGALRSGSNQMQIDASVPSALMYILQALVIMFVIGSNYFIKLRKKHQVKLRAKEDK